MWLLKICQMHWLKCLGLLVIVTNSVVVNTIFSSNRLYYDLSKLDSIQIQFLELQKINKYLKQHQPIVRTEIENDIFNMLKDK